MEAIIRQIQTTSAASEGDAKPLREALTQAKDTLKANAAEIPAALATLEPARHTFGVAWLLEAQLSAAVVPDLRQTFDYVGAFLQAADEVQAKLAAAQISSICKWYAQAAIEEGQQARLRSLRPLLSALTKVRPTAETLTVVHMEFLRVCLKAKAYHIATRVLDQPIYDIEKASSLVTAEVFLCYFYYGALARIGLKQYVQALQLLLVVLTCPATYLSAIQADAYKKFVLVSLKVSGELHSLPMYASQVVQRFPKIPNYAVDIANAFKEGDMAALRAIVSDKAQAIQADDNMGLAKQVVQSLQRHKVRMLTNTYLTLSLEEIAKEIGLAESLVDQSKVASAVEDLLFDMISSGEINARIDEGTGNVFFEDDTEDMDTGMVAQVQDKLQQIMSLAQRVATFEQQVVSSEAYIRRTMALEGGGANPVAAVGGYDLLAMDM